MSKFFKKIIVVSLLFVITFALTGCNSSKNPIIGQWTSEMGEFIYTFNEDGTGKYDSAGNIMEFTYTIESGKLSITYKGNTVPFETEYTIDGKKLIIKDSYGNDTIYNKK